MLSPEYVEAILLWSGNQGPGDAVIKWLAVRELSVQPMTTSLLITGTLASFESAFHVALTTEEPPIDLPVPNEIANEVGSITIPPPRQYCS